MRRILLSIVLTLTVLQPVCAIVSVKDSLLTALSEAHDTGEKMRLYRDLADVYSDSPKKRGYLFQLYKQAEAMKDTRQMGEALTDLTVALLGQLDSARYYAALCAEVMPADQRDQWCCYLSMRIFNMALTNENVNDAIEDKITEIQQRDIADESPYKQIEAEYILGIALLEKDQPYDAIPHLLKALEAADRLPLQEASLYQLQTMQSLSRAYDITKQSDKSLEVVKRAIELQEQNYNRYLKPRRPFYPINDFYITQYPSLLANAPNLPKEEVQFYVNRLKLLSKQSTSPIQKYDCFRGLYNYFASNQNLNQAVIYNDSMIYYTKLIAPYNLPDLYRTSSYLFDFLGRHKEALAYLRESYRLKDSIQQSDMQVKLSQLQVEYGVNQLNYEKSQLEIRNKRSLVVGLTILLILVLFICIYLYTSLKREQEMKKHMEVLKLRAEESEKLKTAFTNSICHEIRTPLNGIVGFAELLLDPTIEEEIKSTFPSEIQQNTDQLITLVDRMLEVANLDVSNVQLPCAPTDITQLCRTDFDLMRQERRGIESVLEVPDEALIASTNERYISLVIRNLIDNAYKFTEQGRITLRCERRNDTVEISVSDTGCGIPAEKRETVFERFIKLNSYTPGSGLGLYLCRLIVQRLSGRIYIDPDYTQGARMVVVLNITND